MPACGPGRASGAWRTCQHRHGAVAHRLATRDVGNDVPGAALELGALRVERQLKLKQGPSEIGIQLALKLGSKRRIVGRFLAFDDLVHGLVVDELKAPDTARRRDKL